MVSFFDVDLYGIKKHEIGTKYILLNFFLQLATFI